jgi:hypothetical protein
MDEALQLDAVNAWHLHVSNQTRRFIDVFRPQKVLCGGKSVGRETERSHETSSCRSDGLVIVHD